MIGFDIETELATQSRPTPRPVCVSLAYPNGKVSLHLPTDPEVHRALQGQLTGWNIAGFDLVSLLCHVPSLRETIWDGLEAGRYFDSMLADRLWNYALGRPSRYFRSQADAAAELLKIKVEKEDTFRLRYGELIGLPVAEYPLEAVTYALEDARISLEIFRAQVALHITTEDGGPSMWVRDMQLQARAAFGLALIAAPGAPVDASAVTALTSRLTSEQEAHRVAGTAGGAIRANGVRDKARIQAMARDLATESGILPPLTEKKGDLQIGEEWLDQVATKLANHNHPSLVTLRHVVEYGKLMTMLGDGVTTGRIAELCAGGTYRFRSRYDSIKETGRTGASGARSGKVGPSWGGNVQNLPRSGGIRECFRAPKGKLFIICDYSALELYAFAQNAYERLGFSVLRDTLLAGRDPHANTAAGFLGCSYDDFSTLDKATKKQYRTLAKPFNFGIIGLMGQVRFCTHAAEQYHVQITAPDFWRYKRILFDTYPEIPLYLDMMRDQNIVEMIGTRRLRGGLGPSDACNTPFQGTGSDCSKEGVWGIVKHCYHPRGRLHGVTPWAFIHDEIPAMCNDDADAPRKALAFKKIMEVYGSRWTPAIPLKAEVILCRVWSKSLDPTYDEHGNLTVSEWSEK